MAFVCLTNMVYATFTNSMSFIFTFVFLSSPSSRSSVAALTSPLLTAFGDFKSVVSKRTQTGCAPHANFIMSN